MAKLDEVFGLRDDANVESYFIREIERDFEKALNDRTIAAVMLYGTSKQGKSSLKRKVVEQRVHINITCSNNNDLKQLLQNILRKSKIVVVDSSTIEVGGTLEAKAKLFGIGGAVEGQIKTSRETHRVPIDFGDPDAVATAIMEETPYRLVVLDDFHYLDKDIQRLFSTAIRSFTQNGIRFVIAGTWSDRDYLLKFNPDLKGKIKAISLEPWSEPDLNAVISKGERALKINLSPRIKSSLVTTCEGNIGLLQKMLKDFLESKSILQTSSTEIAIADYATLDRIIQASTTELESTVFEHFKSIAAFGTVWIDGRTRMYWILRAYLQGSREQIVGFFGEDQLFENTNALVRTKNKDEHMLEQTFKHIIRKDLLSHQQDTIKSPILAFDAGAKGVIILDSWTKFVLKMRRVDIAKRF